MPLAPLTAPRALRRTPPTPATDLPHAAAALVAALEVAPHAAATPAAELDTLLAAFASTPDAPDAPDHGHPVPQVVHNAMHALVLAAGSLRQQSNMERALTRWLGWNPAEFHPRVNTATLAGGRARFREHTDILSTPSTRALRERAREAHTDLADTPNAPDALRALGAALRALALRLAETSTLRRARLTGADPLPHEPATTSPRDLTEGEPPALDLTPDALTRRANLTARTPAVALTRTLTIAPGAPSRPVCV